MVRSGNYSISEHNNITFKALARLGGNKSEHIAKAVKDYISKINTSDGNLRPDFDDNIAFWIKYFRNMSEKEALEHRKKQDQIDWAFGKGIERFVR